MHALSLITNGYITPIRRIAQLVGSSMSPAESQRILVKALELPLPSTVTEALGIHQSDIIIRTAIVAAIADLRAKPYLLDYIFASLPRDELTLRDYGEKEVQNAKDWFLKTDIPVVMDYRLDHAQFPCITISLQESVEAEQTLGDVHYKPTDEVEAAWPVLAGPFTPVDYEANTGLMTIPDAVAEVLVLAPGMLIIDNVGRQHVIEQVLDTTVAQIKPGTIADFRTCTIKSERPPMMATLESLAFRETYQIGCHVQSDSAHLTYLWSIVYFVLLAYKQALLEARGFERSILSSTQFQTNQTTQNELVYSRYINIQGHVRNYWPKQITPRIQGAGVQISVGEVNVPGESTSDGESLWVANDPIEKK